MDAIRTFRHTKNQPCYDIRVLLADTMSGAGLDTATTKTEAMHRCLARFYYPREIGSYLRKFPDSPTPEHPGY